MLLSDALHVVTGFCRDQDVVTFFGKDWHADHETVVHSGVLEDVAGSGVALNGGVRLGDDVFDFDWEFHADGFLAVHDDGDVQALLEEPGVVTHHVATNGDLLVALAVHEGEGVFVTEDELHLLEADLLKGDAFGGLEVVLDNLARAQGLKAGTNKGAAFTWANALETDADPKVVFVVKDGAFADVIWRGHSLTKAFRRWEQVNRIDALGTSFEHDQTVDAQGIAKGW